MKALAEAIANVAATLSVPAGIVMPFVGTTAPPGWALCDGQGGRPDLRDKFPRPAPLAEVGRAGGAATVSIAVANMPSHTHNITLNSATAAHAHAAGNSTVNIGTDNATHSHTPIAPITAAPDGYSAGNSQVANQSGGWYVPDGSANAPDLNAGLPGHAHTFTARGNSAAAAQAAHTHTLPAATGNSTGTGSPHGGPPPYYAVNFIIKL